MVPTKFLENKEMKNIELFEMTKNDKQFIPIVRL